MQVYLYYSLCKHDFVIITLISYIWILTNLIIMKINYLQISNVLSFKHEENIENATKINFNEDINILIGQNGSGKSTVLEVINFILKRVLFVEYTFNRETYNMIERVERHQIKSIISKLQREDKYSNFRLEPNWLTSDKESKIKFEIEIDDIDIQNFEYLKSIEPQLKLIAEKYSNEPFGDLSQEPSKEKKIIEVNLNKLANNYSSTYDGKSIMDYFRNYNFYNKLIELYNIENSGNPLRELTETMSVLSAYRNYSQFISDSTLQSRTANLPYGVHDSAKQSINDVETNEPKIFNTVRSKLIEIFQGYLNTGGLDYANEEINKNKLLVDINEKLRLINLKLRINLIELAVWNFSFTFTDLSNTHIVSNINSLSAGQKSILHLIFETYGRVGIKGGVIIIDEPEIHLHHQLQDEYLRVIKELQVEQKTQYILVTHSESFINSSTINKVLRFGLDDQSHSFIKSPTLNTSQNSLIKILDNTRSTFAFFANKILLVEGDTDRYFFQSVFNKLYPELKQSLAILHMGGKGNYKNFKEFFEQYGLKVFFIGDFDNVFSLKLPTDTIVDKSNELKYINEIKQTQLNTMSSPQKKQLENKIKTLIKDDNYLIAPNIDHWTRLFSCFDNICSGDKNEVVRKILEDHPNIISNIESKYIQNVFILKKGAIEAYTGTSHRSIHEMANYCETNLDTLLASNSEEGKEINHIVALIKKS